MCLWGFGVLSSECVKVKWMHTPRRSWCLCLMGHGDNSAVHRNLGKAVPSGLWTGREPFAGRLRAPTGIALLRF